MLRGSSDSGRKRRTFRNWRSGTASAPGSNNSLDRNNSFSTGRFLFQFSGNTQHVKRHLKAQIILNAESQMFFLQSFALWMRMTRADLDLDRLQQMKWLSVVRRILAKCANQSWKKVYLGERIYFENQYKEFSLECVFYLYHNAIYLRSNHSWKLSSSWCQLTSDSWEICAIGNTRSPSGFKLLGSTLCTVLMCLL